MTENSTDHRDRLLASGRCGDCAESVTEVAILRARDCPHCDAPLQLDRRDILQDMRQRQSRWRLLGYALVAVASLLAGFFPLLQWPVQLTALFILHIVVLRGALNWLSPGRRALTRIALRLWGTAIACLALVLNLAVAPLAGLSALILAGAAPAMTAIYVEGGLAMIRRRLDWEARAQPLKLREWVVPLGLLIGLVATVLVGLSLVYLVVDALANIEVPGVASIAEWLEEKLQ